MDELVTHAISNTNCRLKLCLQHSLLKERFRGNAIEAIKKLTNDGQSANTITNYEQLPFHIGVMDKYKTSLSAMIRINVCR